MTTFTKLTPTQRLKAIQSIIESVDHRAMAADGPVTPTRQAMTDTEMRIIYQLSKFATHVSSVTMFIPPRKRKRT